MQLVGNWSRTRLAKASVVWMFCAAISLSGCGPKAPPKPVPVKGTVVFRGKPLANARVSFYGPGAPLPASGDTNDNGEFVLTMYKDGDGALVGENKVTVISLPKSGGALASPPDPTKIAKGEVDPGANAKIPKAGPDIIPKVYGDLAHTTLVWTVKPEGETSAKIELK